MDGINFSGSILVLNSDYLPLNITSWKRAVVLLLKQKAHIISEKVIRLVNYVKIPFSVNNTPTRKLIHKRDNYRCQYCGTLNNLTIDHVIPTSRGGNDSWENLVTACLSCNLFKGNKLLSEINMPLRRKPRRPFSPVMLSLQNVNISEWKQFVVPM